ncbi:MAG: GTP-binding protein [Aquificae bacterium]|nr:GTP-binding protein [Aquificota bacterium]
MRSAFVVTGYLGSGKTTLLLNAARKHLSGKRVAVVVNEVGQTGLDGRILSKAYGEVLELPEGCVCCKLTRAFEEGVSRIVREYDPEVLLVETSGDAVPFPVVFSLKTLGFAVEAVICVVDAKNFLRYKDDETAVYQLAGSNAVVVNKVDLVSKEELERVKEEVRRIKKEHRLVNLFAPDGKEKPYALYEAVRGEVPPELFAGAGRTLELPEELPHLHEQCREARLLKLPAVVKEEELLKLFEQFEREGVIRAKGVARVEGFPYPTFVHYVFGDYDYLNPAEGFEGEPFLVVIK